MTPMSIAMHSHFPAVRLMSPAGLLVTLSLLLASAGLAADTRPADAGIKLLSDPRVRCANPLPDFSYAGYRFGEQEPPALAPGVEVDATQYGVTPDDELDDSQALLAALKAAHAVQGPVVVQLPPGRLIVSAVMRIERSDLVLRGAGAGEGGTQLYFPRPLRQVDPAPELDELREYLKVNDKRQIEKARNVDVPFSEFSWSGGFIWISRPGMRSASYLPEHDPPPRRDRITRVVGGRAGQRTMTVASAAAIKQGDVVQLRWFNRGGRNGPLLEQLYGKTDLDIGERHWDRPDVALVRQPLVVQAVQGNVLTVSAPLMHDAGQALEADLARWTPLRNVGVEELALSFPKAEAYGHHMEEGYNAIYVNNLMDGWIRNVHIANADSGVLSYDSAALTVSDVVMSGERRAHYSVHLGNVHGVLVRDLTLLNPVVHSASVNTQSSRNVFLRTRIFKEPVLDQHAGSNHQNLFDQITMDVTAQRDAEGKAWYPVWNGSGASYWEPGHGLYNTTWNLRVLVQGGAAPGESVRLAGEAEGPGARIVGLSSNRPLTLDYRPAPYTELIGTAAPVPSLYEYQLAQRRGAVRVPDCEAAGDATASASAR